MHLSTTAWVILILLVVFIIALNLNLVFALRKKPPQNHWTNQIKKANETLEHPWKNEDDQFAELSQKVSRLSNNKKKDEDRLP